IAQFLLFIIMSETRSRSEIESALSGKQRLYKRKVNTQTRQDSLTDFEFEARVPRRQQVIGGDLTGVSNRRGRNSILSKLAEIHFTNWLAGFVVVAILVAFFWPSNNIDSIREVVDANGNIQPETQAFYTESRIDGKTQTESPNEIDLSFSKLSDVDRANQFRAQEEAEQRIEELLINAKQFIAKNQYISPEGNNALNSYREILASDASNSDALEGLKALKNQLLENGRNALSANNQKQAVEMHAALAEVDLNSSQYKRLTTDIETWQTETEIAETLSKAKQAQDADNLILPADRSSLYYFKQVLALDSDNPDAKSGLSDIMNIYISRANQAILDGELEKATAHLASASIVDANHPSIGLVSEMIATAEPIVAQTEVKRQQNNTNPERQQEPVAKAEELVEEAKLPEQTAMLATNQSALNRSISDVKTPQQQADEQAQFDQIYLEQGLDAYYRGDYDKAVALLQPLADKGVSRAQFRIGYMHYLGRGVPRNRREADRILRAALPAVQKFANEGRSWAQSDLGSLYEDGLVLPRDYSEAVYWYRSAAEQGYPGAQTNLGIMYARGLGVSTSRQTAIEWFQRAAKQGDIAAQRNLASLGVN
ncbi:MAG: sel1 repeat family protein, partial [Acidiferrobacterales bacterium]|nr:sel1 repeat family protein [Acidiferrobacterales bacterium]